MHKHLLVIDALNLIRRIFSVQQRQLDNPQQLVVATRAAVGNAGRAMLKNLAPSHVIAVFDSPEAPSWRKQLHPEYKAKRKPMPSELQAHLPQIQDELLEIGIDSAESGPNEADDLCATLAIKAAQGGFNCTIVSTDQGYYPILGPRIAQYDYFKREYLQLNELEAKFELALSQLPDYWALVGNTSDGVTGVPGIGAKSAKTLLQTYQSCQGILAASDEDKLVKKVQQHQEQLALAQQLLGLQTELQLGFNLKHLRLGK